MDRLAAHVEGAGIPLMLGMNMRWHLGFRPARELIRAGELGEIRGLRTTLASREDSEGGPEWRTKRRLGGGVLVEMGVHHFDLWQFLLDDNVEEVSVITRGDDSIAVGARMSSGVLVSSLFAYRTAHLNEVEILGDAGRLRASPYSAPLRLDTARMPWAVQTKLADISSTLSLTHAVRGRRAGGFFTASFVAEWRHFLQAVTRGTPVETGVGYGRRLLQVMLAAAASANDGRAVRCEDAPASLAPPATP